MKKYLASVLLVFILSSTICFAEEWDDFGNLDRAWDGQKAVTNKEFEQVVDALQEKNKKKEKKLWKRKAKKISGGGTSLHNELNPDNEIKELQSLKPKEEGILLNVSVDLHLEDSILERGYYKVISEKNAENKKLYVKFYQSQFFKGELEVIETEEDFGEETLDFVRILPYNESFVKIIFGSIDFNAYAFVPYSE